MTIDLDSTIRVAADGTITRGIDVPHRAANIRDGGRVLAASPRKARGSRFRGSGGIPRGVNLNITAPHDCEKHVAL